MRKVTIFLGICVLLTGISFLIKNQPPISTIFYALQSKGFYNLISVNQQSKEKRVYDHWVHEALNQKNYELCRNVEAFFDLDLYLDKEAAIHQCQYTVAVGIGDVTYCEKLNGSMKITCLKQIAETFNQPSLFTKELCFSFANKREFADCFLEFARLQKNEEICKIFQEKELWNDYSACLYTVAKTEKRTDNVKDLSTQSNFDQISLQCSHYNTSFTRSLCYVDSLEGLLNRVNIQGFIETDRDKNFEDFCIQHELTPSWEGCLYIYYKILNGSSQFQRVKELQHKMLSSAQGNAYWKEKTCLMIRFVTSANLLISDPELKNFSVKTCGWKYLDD